MNDFLSIPQFVWELIFKVVEVLLVGLILGVFASRYQKRKEYEIKIKGELLQLRLKAYERIAKVTYKIYNIIAPSLQEQAKIGEILDGLPFTVRNIEYNSFFSSMESFDDYYREVSTLIREEKVFLDYSIEKILSQYISYLSEIKMLLDAFADTEHIVDNKFSEITAKQHIDLSYQVFGVALQNDFARFYAVIDQKISHQLRNIDLDYEKHYFRRMYNRMCQAIIKYLEKYLDKEDWRSDIYFKLLHRLYGNSELMQYPQYLSLILMFIHYSDKYSRDVFDGLPKEKRKSYMEKFSQMYQSQLHHA